MNAPKENDCEYILIVEGYSDLLFCAAFLQHLGKLDRVFIKELKGKSNVLKRDTLKTYLSPKFLSEKKAIGIIVDADDNAPGTKTALENLLREITGRDVTESLWSEGQPRLGFFVAPDGQNPGELETLVWNAWADQPANHDAKTSVIGHLAHMKEAGFDAKSPDKARIGAYLAAAHDEDPRLGPGAREGKFDFSDSGFDRLRDFLNGLKGH